MGAVIASLALLIGAMAGAVAPGPPRDGVPHLTSVTAVSCPSAHRCVASATTASGSLLLTTSDGGARWTSARAPIALSTLDCPSTTVCVGGGLSDRVLTTTSGGRRWARHLVSSSLAEVDAVSCPSPDDCYLSGIDVGNGGIDVSVYRSVDSGKVWSLVRTPSLIVPMDSTSGISCADRSHCVVTGYGVVRTSDGGTTWQRFVTPRTVLDEADCISDSRCLALSNVTSAVPENASGSLYATSDAGRRWTRRIAPRHVADLAGLSCSSATRCVAVGGGYTPGSSGTYTSWGVVETSADGGRTWAEQRETGLSYLLGVSCATGSTRCVAVGASSAGGALLVSGDHGASWRPVTVS